MQPQVFKFSEKTIEKRNKYFWVIRLSLPIILLAFVFANLVTASMNTGIMLGSFVFALIIVEAILFIEPAIIFAKWRQLEIRIADEAIERSGGKFVESIRFADISRIVVNANKAGQVISIKVQSPSKGIIIAGFEDMNLLSDTIEEGVSDKSVI